MGQQHTSNVKSVDGLDHHVLRLRGENKMLRAEIEKLRMQLYWSQNNTTRFRAAMIDVNLDKDGPQCACRSCEFFRRSTDGFCKAVPPPERPLDTCAWLPFFEQKMRDAGIVFDRIAYPEIKFMPGIGYTCEDDVHIGWYDSHVDWRYDGIDDWSYAYGKKLWSARSDDPELTRFAAFLDSCRRRVC